MLSTGHQGLGSGQTDQGSTFGSGLGSGKGTAGGYGSSGLESGTGTDYGSGSVTGQPKSITAPFAVLCYAWLTMVANISISNVSNPAGSEIAQHANFTLWTTRGVLLPRS